MKLIFVYNADAGFMSRVLDTAHKAVSRDTYACNLCALTYGYVLEKPAWKAFVRDVDAEAVFLHRDEFIEQYSPYSKTPLPVVFQERGSELTVVMSADEINQFSTLDDLIAGLQQRLQS